jgi:hypothetical protein
MGVSLSAGLWFTGSFTASTKYKTTTSTAETNGWKYIYLKAQCSLLQYKLQPYASHAVTADFDSAVYSLPLDASSTAGLQAYYDLIETFGTHYTTAVRMGGQMVQETTIKESSMQTLESQSIDFAAELGVSYAAASGSTGVSTEDAEHAAEVVENYKETQTAYYSGGKAFSPNPQEWYEGLIADSSVVPIGAGLAVTPLHEALKNEYFPYDGYIGVKKANLLAALESYCDYLGPNVCSIDPTDPDPLPPLPPAPTVSPIPEYSLTKTGTWEKVLVEDNGKNICFLTAVEGMGKEESCKVISKQGMWKLVGHSEESAFLCNAHCATSQGKIENKYSADGEYVLSGGGTEEITMAKVQASDGINRNACYLTNLNLWGEKEACKIVYSMDGKSWVLRKESDDDNDFVQCGARCATVGGNLVAQVEFDVGADDKNVYLAMATDENAICYLTGVSNLRDTLFGDVGKCSIAREASQSTAGWYAWMATFQSNEYKSFCSAACINLAWVDGGDLPLEAKATAPKLRGAAPKVSSV